VKQRTIVVYVGGATDDQYVTMANDVWARLSDPPEGVTISVQPDDAALQRRLNKDYDERYRNVERWESDRVTRGSAKTRQSPA
jgi:hypothetical protein